MTLGRATPAQHQTMTPGWETNAAVQPPALPSDRGRPQPPAAAASRSCQLFQPLALGIRRHGALRARRKGLAKHHSTACRAASGVAERWRIGVGAYAQGQSHPHPFYGHSRAGHSGVGRSNHLWIFQPAHMQRGGDTSAWRRFSTGKTSPAHEALSDFLSRPVRPSEARVCTVTSPRRRYNAVKTAPPCQNSTAIRITIGRTTIYVLSKRFPGGLSRGRHDVAGLKT